MMDDQRVLDAVRAQALRYLRAGGGTPTIERIWIESREDDGDIVVKVQWTSDDLEPGQLVDDMIYTVSELGNDDLHVHGPEW